MVKRIVVTGAAGQIAYSLLFQIAKGDLLGKDQPIALHLLEVEPMLPALKGVIMELQDCAFPLLQEIKWGSDPRKIFEGVEIAFLVGAKPRGPGMERKDLLQENGKIFVEQGKALNDVAASSLITLVVGNPANTNCLIALKHAPKHKHFFSMMLLDQHRAQAKAAEQVKVKVQDVHNVVVWGNHSATQVPDLLNATIKGKPALELIDRKWYEEEFFSFVQKRGAEVIAARGKSSAASAAHAAMVTMQSLLKPTDCFSCGLLSTGNPYGIKDDLMFSFPCKSYGNGKVEILPGYTWDPFLKEKIALTEKELLEEKAAAL